MYLSQIKLNPRRRSAAKILSSPHVLHAAVLASFPDPSPTDTGRVLWRLDTAAHSSRVYIVSPTQPDLTHLAEQAGWPTLSDTWAVRPYEPFLDRISSGHQYAFKLTANPVRSIPSGSNARGKISGHMTVKRQENWLLSRQERLGFEVCDAVNAETGETFKRPPDPDFKMPISSHYKAMTINDRRTVTFSRRETSVTLQLATFEGLLTVTNAEAFIRTLCFGIGRAKGYGCGLMTLAPIR